MRLTLTWAEAEALYGIAVRADEDGRWMDGHERRAGNRALDKFAFAKAAARDADRPGACNAHDDPIPSMPP